MVLGQTYWDKHTYWKLALQYEDLKKTFLLDLGAPTFLTSFTASSRCFPCHGFLLLAGFNSERCALLNWYFNLEQNHIRQRGTTACGHMCAGQAFPPHRWRIRSRWNRWNTKHGFNEQSTMEEQLEKFTNFGFRDMSFYFFQISKRARPPSSQAKPPTSMATYNPQSTISY
jgi:hypothetical protein